MALNRAPEIVELDPDLRDYFTVTFEGSGVKCNKCDRPFPGAARRNINLLKRHLLTHGIFLEQQQPSNLESIEASRREGCAQDEITENPEDVERHPPSGSRIRSEGMQREEPPVSAPAERRDPVHESSIDDMDPDNLITERSEDDEEKIREIQEDVCKQAQQANEGIRKETDAYSDKSSTDDMDNLVGMESTECTLEELFKNLEPVDNDSIQQAQQAPEGTRKETGAYSDISSSIDFSTAKFEGVFKEEYEKFLKNLYITLPYGSVVYSIQGVLETLERIEKETGACSDNLEAKRATREFTRSQADQAIIDLHKRSRVQEQREKNERERAQEQPAFNPYAPGTSSAVQYQTPEPPKRKRKDSGAEGVPGPSRSASTAEGHEPPRKDQSKRNKPSELSREQKNKILYDRDKLLKIARFHRSEFRKSKPRFLTKKDIRKNFSLMDDNERIRCPECEKDFDKMKPGEVLRRHLAFKHNVYDVIRTDISETVFRELDDDYIIMKSSNKALCRYCVQLLTYISSYHYLKKHTVTCTNKLYREKFGEQ